MRVAGSLFRLSEIIELPFVVAVLVCGYGIQQMLIVSERSISKWFCVFERS